MKKNKKNWDEGREHRFEDYDYHGYYKSVRKGEKRKSRHNTNKDIRDIIRGGMTPEEYDDNYEDEN